MATGAALGTIGMGAVWYLTWFPTTYIPLDTRLWLAVVVVVAGAVGGALGGLVGKGSRS